MCSQKNVLRTEAAGVNKHENGSTCEQCVCFILLEVSMSGAGVPEDERREVLEGVIGNEGVKEMIKNEK